MLCCAMHDSEEIFSLYRLKYPEHEFHRSPLSGCARWKGKNSPAQIFVPDVIPLHALHISLYDFFFRILWISTTQHDTLFETILMRESETAMCAC